MQAITVKYTRDRNGNSRVTAKCQAGRVSRQHNQAVSFDTDAADCAAELVQKLGWSGHGEWHIGCVDDGAYAVVCANTERAFSKVLA